MEKRLYELTSYFLNLAGEEFSHHSCNDINDDDIWEHWTDVERKQFLIEFHGWNGTSEEYEEDPEDTFITDWQIFDFLSNKFSELAKK